MMYRGYRIRIGAPRPEGCVQIWSADGTEHIETTTDVGRAEKIIDGWLDAP